MGLNQRFLQLMVWLKSEGHLTTGNRVMEIGAQQLNDGFLQASDDIDQLCKLFCVSRPALPPPRGKVDKHRLDKSAPYANTFFRALGFEYACIDIDRNVDAIPLDLNFDSVPQSSIGQYDLITNFGTTEHVANQLNAFKIIHDLAARDAIMIHELPSQGSVNHGLINYHPKFFERLARNNDYQILFADFNWSAVEYGLPNDIDELTRPFCDTADRPKFGVSPAAMNVVFRKTQDRAFVPPLDVPYGSKAPSRQIEVRYAPVFQQNRGLSRWSGNLRSWLFRR